MPEIIPAIIAKDFAELEAKIKLVEPQVKTVQLDVMDGVFVPNKTWPYFAPQGGATNGKPYFVETTNGKPFLCDLEKLETNLALEAHLMVDNPHRVLNEWLNSKVKRVILHWEAMEKIHNHELLPYKTQVGVGWPVSNLAEEIHKRDKEFGVALNLETPIGVLDNFISEIDMVLLMSVKPGRGGQEFQESVISKIEQLRQKYPNVKIEVDGGVNLQNAKRLKDAGADFLVMGSAIFESNNISETTRELKSVLLNNFFEL